MISFRRDLEMRKLWTKKKTVYCNIEAGILFYLDSFQHIVTLEILKKDMPALLQF